MNKPDKIDQLEQRLRDDAPAWRQRTTAMQTDAPVVDAPSALRFVWPAAAAVAAAIVLITATLLTGLFPLDHHRHKIPPLVSTISASQVFATPVAALEQPLASEARLLVEDVQSATRSAFGPIMAFGSPPGQR